MIGKQIGRYKITEKLGEGGMAEVYKAFDTRLERDVAIKILKLNGNLSEEFLKRFELEARTLAKLNHASIVRILDYGVTGDQPYIVMEYLPGGSLKNRLGEPMPYQEACQLLAPIARGLTYAHQHGIIHRDIKPGNILFADSGTPMLADFGIAKVMELDETIDLTGTGMGMGTPEYMAPEQGLGTAVDFRTDIYALGTVLYELIVGKKPYQADTPMGVLYQHAYHPLPRPRKTLPDLPIDMEALILKAMAKDPKDRFSDTASFAAALEKNAQRVGAMETHPTKQPTNLKSIFIGGAFAVIGAAVYFLFLRDGGDETPQIALPESPLPTASRTLISTQLPPTATPRPTATPFPTATPTPIVVEINTADKAPMVLIPAGEFMMGSDPDQDPYFWGAEGPQHTVNLGDYWIYQFEVTNQMYQACVEQKACPIPQHEKSYTRDDYFENAQYAEYPVVYVNWTSAQAYCKWAGGRLPTEAEWEKAARGTDGRLFSWGNGAPSGNLVNYCDKNCPASLRDSSQDDSYRDTAPVGSFPAGASPYGVMDMSGNVSEWVFDWFQPLYYEISPLENPVGPANGDKNQRVTRGGSFYNPDEGIRIVARYPRPASDAFDTVGFRCAVDLH